eukprot:EG_transcript_52937
MAQTTWWLSSPYHGGGQHPGEPPDLSPFPEEGSGVLMPGWGLCPEGEGEGRPPVGGPGRLPRGLRWAAPASGPWTEASDVRALAFTKRWPAGPSTPCDGQPAGPAIAGPPSGSAPPRST